MLFIYKKQCYISSTVSYQVNVNSGPRSYYLVAIPNPNSSKDLQYMRKNSGRKLLSIWLTHRDPGGGDHSAPVTWEPWKKGQTSQDNNATLCLSGLWARAVANPGSAPQYILLFFICGPPKITFKQSPILSYK